MATYIEMMDEDGERVVINADYIQFIQFTKLGDKDRAEIMMSSGEPVIVPEDIGKRIVAALNPVRLR